MPPIAQQLPKIAWSRNIIPFVVQSADYRQAVPAFSVNKFVINGPVNAGDVLPLTWDVGAANLTASFDPNDTGLMIPAGDGSGSYAADLIDWINGNQFVVRDYVLSVDISGAKPIIYATARKAGPEYDLNNFVAGNVTCTVLTAGITAALKANFRHHIQVIIRNAANDGYLSTFEGNVELDYPLTGKTTLDLGEDTLHSFLAPDQPEMGAAASRCLRSIREYYCLYSQYQGTVPTVWRLRNTGKNFVAMGGLGTQAALVRNLVSELCPVPADAAQNRFLRQGSKNKIVRTDQPEWLTWINLSIYDMAVALEVTIYNDDTTTQTFNSIAALAVPSYAKFQFQTGYTQLGIAGRQAAGKKPLYYTCRIKGPAGYLTAAYAYVIEYTYRQWPRYFVFFNSYGAFQTVRTIGKGFRKYDRNKDDARLAADQATAAITGEFMECNISIQEKFSVNAGYAESGRRNVALYRDFFLSPATYVYEDGKLIPISIDTKNIEEPLDGQYVYANSFEYSIKYEEVNYTEDPTKVIDDSIAELLNNAGTPPPVVPPNPTLPSVANGYIVVDYNDIHLSIDGGLLVYTLPSILAGKTNYRIHSTEKGDYFRTEDIAYDQANGSFKILLPAIKMPAGEQLTIWPYIILP